MSSPKPTGAKGRISPDVTKATKLSLPQISGNPSLTTTNQPGRKRSQSQDGGIISMPLANLSPVNSPRSASPRIARQPSDDLPDKYLSMIPEDHPMVKDGASLSSCPIFAVAAPLPDENAEWRQRSDKISADRFSDSSSEKSKKSTGNKKKSSRSEDEHSQASDDSGQWGHSNNLNQLFQHEVDSDDEGDIQPGYEHMDTTALRREIKLLHRINNFTRDIAENSNQAIVVVEAETKKIYWVNGRAQVMFGKLVDDLIDQNVNILLPPEIARKHDRYIDNYISAWQKEKMPPESKVVNPRSPREIKAVRFMSDGTRTYFTAEMFVRYMKVNGRNDKPPKLFMAYINDITEMKGLKHQLSVSKVIQQKSNEAIVVCDLFGKILNCNNVCEQMFGTSLSFLLAHNKNIKWFMPRNIAEKHDGYLANFRDNLSAGSYDIQKSTMIGKIRSMKGRRPGDNEDELFSIVLRVELVEETLVAYIRDVSDTITKSEFNSALVSKVFPKCIKNKVLHASTDAYGVCDTYTNKTVIYTDLENFTKYGNGAEVTEVYKFVNAMYKAFDVIVPQFAGEVVKRTGDGVIAVFGLVGNAKKHADRAIYCCIALLRWATDNHYKMRVGVSSGDILSGVFGDSESRPQWDVLGSTVNIASRMQTYGEVSRVHLSDSAYTQITDSRLYALFEQRVVDNVKGYGALNTFLSKELDFLDLAPLLQRRMFEVEHERRRIMEREKRLEELEGQNSIQKDSD